MRQHTQIKDEMAGIQTWWHQATTTAQPPALTALYICTAQMVLNASVSHLATMKRSTGKVCPQERTMLNAFYPLFFFLAYLTLETKKCRCCICKEIEESE